MPVSSVEFTPCTLDPMARSTHMSSNVVAPGEDPKAGKRKLSLPSPLRIPPDMPRTGSRGPAKISISPTSTPRSVQNRGTASADLNKAGPTSVEKVAVTRSVVTPTAGGKFHGVPSLNHIRRGQNRPPSSVYSQSARLLSEAPEVTITACTPACWYRVQSEYTVFEEDEDSDTNEPLTAEARLRTSWQNSPNISSTTPHRSKGWWDIITSPFGTAFSTIDVLLSPRSGTRGWDEKRKVRNPALEAAKADPASDAAGQPARLLPTVTFCASPEDISPDKVLKPSVTISDTREETVPLGSPFCSRQPNVLKKQLSNGANCHQRAYVSQSLQSRLRRRVEGESTLIEGDESFSPFSKVDGGTPIVAMASLGTVHAARSIVEVLHDSAGSAHADHDMPERNPPSQPNVPGLAMAQRVVGLPPRPQERRIRIVEAGRDTSDEPADGAVGSLFPPYRYGIESMRSAQRVDQAYAWDRSVTIVAGQEKQQDKLKSVGVWRVSSSKTMPNAETRLDKRFWMVGLAGGGGLILLIVLFAMFIVP